MPIQRGASSVLHSETMRTSALVPFRMLWKRRGMERRCRWSRAELERHQMRRAAALRRFAMERSPFYRRFHAGFENRHLHELPILSKAALMESFDDVVTDRAIRRADVEEYLKAYGGGGELFRGRYVVLSTSGSTGLRGIFLFSPDEWITALANLTRPMAWVGVNGRLRKPLRMAMVASTTPWHYSSRAGQSLATRMLPSVRLDAGEPVDSMVRRLNEWRPDILSAYPSVVRQLADEQIAGRLRIRLRVIGTAAEVLTPDIRRRAREAWNARIYDTYGATEYSPIAAECAAGSKHLFEDGALIEVVDEKGRPVPPGVAGDRVLLTVFDRYTQPLIRYEISDMVRLAAGECECGRKLRMMDAIEGRVEDVLYFPGRGGGATVAAHPNLFHELLENVPAAGWQVIQDRDGVSVLLAGLRDREVCEPLSRSLRQMLEGRGAEAAAIRVRAVDALERGASGKAPLVVSRLRG